MTKETVLFLASLLLLSTVGSLSGALSVSDQFLLCAPFIVLLGIPHGAIDNILFLNQRRMSNAAFVGYYLLVVGANVLLWLVLPAAAYVLFLFLSAYHFGQSQFSHHFKRKRLYHELLYLLWGLSLLSGLIHLNIADIHSIMGQSTEFAIFHALHQTEPMRIMFVTFTVLTVVLMMLSVYLGDLQPKEVFLELALLGAVFLCFKAMPLIIGFTLYFVMLHSFKVMREEYGFLKKEGSIRTVGGFIWMVAPFTLFSLIGIVLLFGAIHLGLLNMSYGYCLLLVFSSITLPHAFVMNGFYDLLLRKERLKQVT